MKTSVSTFCEETKNIEILINPILDFIGNYALRIHDKRLIDGDITFFFDSKENIINFMDKFTEAFNNFKKEIE